MGKNFSRNQKRENRNEADFYQTPHCLTRTFIDYVFIKDNLFDIDGELAFTMRYYTGNQNAHLKINKKILMKFNIEVAKIKKWITNVQDIVDEFDVTADEAAALWNSSLQLIGKKDLTLIDFVAG